MHCKIVQDALKCQCGQLFCRLLRRIFLNQCKKLKLYSLKLRNSSSLCFALAVGFLSLTKKVFTTLTSLMCMPGAHWNLSPCTCPNVPHVYVPMCPHAILRKIRFIINSKCPSTCLTFIFVFLTNGESNSQKEKNLGISILVIVILVNSKAR